MEDEFLVSNDQSFGAAAYYFKHRIVNANQSFAAIFKYSPEEIRGIYVNDLFTLEAYTLAIKNSVLGHERVQVIDCRNKDGEIFKCAIGNKAEVKNGKTIGILTAKPVEIIAELKARQYDKYTALFENSIDGIFMCTIDGRYLDANSAFISILGYNDKKELTESFVPEQLIMQNSKNILNDMQTEKRYETYLIKKDGEKIEIEVSVCIIFEKTSPAYIQGIVRDVTTRKDYEKKIQFLSFHDRLTGLYNRAFFEEEIVRLDNGRNLPLSVIVADVSGLKLINDTFGHAEGDKLLKSCGDVFRNSTRKGDILARWGGDEFAILLPKTSENDAEEILSRIKEDCNCYKDNMVSLNIALGIATKNLADIDFRKVMKEADDSMYTNKLIDSKNVSDSIFASLKRTLYEKSIETEIHAERLKNLAVKLGQTIGLPKRKLEELILLASLHDIGKVAISEDILKKEEALTPNEWELIKKHPHTGYRIVLSCSQLAPISKGILYHHENWDGSGYPHGISGENIPITSRIICIVDAYDVMVNGRCYKKPVSKQDAVNELKRCAGKQFDPYLVSHFIAIDNKLL